jgi:hypothetical protein
MTVVLRGEGLSEASWNGSNSDNAESIFGHLLMLTIADTFKPLEWENYVPYDRAPSVIAR